MYRAFTVFPQALGSEEDSWVIECEYNVDLFDTRGVK